MYICMYVYMCMYVYIGLHHVVFLNTNSKDMIIIFMHNDLHTFIELYTRSYNYYKVGIGAGTTGGI